MGIIRALGVIYKAVHMLKTRFSDRVGKVQALEMTNGLWLSGTHESVHAYVCICECENDTKVIVLPVVFLIFSLAQRELWEGEIFSFLSLLAYFKCSCSTDYEMHYIISRSTWEDLAI